LLVKLFFVAAAGSAGPVPTSIMNIRL